MASIKTCPHCGNRFVLKGLKTPCGKCGYVFEARREGPEPEASPLVSLLLDGGHSPSGSFPEARAAILALLAVMTIAFLGSNNLQSGSVINAFFRYVNLPFHEAGHIFFSVLGNALIASAGGTLLQFLMPLVCCLTLLLKTKDPFGAAVAFWWIAENFIDIAPYVNDARAGVLPLLGGNFGRDAPYGFHDWEFILGELGLSKYDHFLASASVSAGLLCMALALVWGGTALYRGFVRERNSSSRGGE